MSLEDMYRSALNNFFESGEATKTVLEMSRCVGSDMWLYLRSDGTFATLWVGEESGREVVDKDESYHVLPRLDIPQGAWVPVSRGDFTAEEFINSFYVDEFREKVTRRFKDMWHEGQEKYQMNQEQAESALMEFFDDKGLMARAAKYAIAPDYERWYVELLPHKGYRLLWRNTIGNLYVSEGVLLEVPRIQVDEDEWSDVRDDRIDIDDLIDFYAPTVRRRLLECLERYYDYQ